MHVPDLVKHAAAALARHAHDEVARAGALHASRIGAKIVAALLFVVACAALALLRRRLVARARTEEAEQVLRDEFTRLDDEAHADASSPRRER